MAECDPESRLDSDPESDKADDNLITRKKRALSESSSKSSDSTFIQVKRVQLDLSGKPTAGKTPPDIPVGHPEETQTPALATSDHATDRSPPPEAKSKRGRGGSSSRRGKPRRKINDSVGGSPDFHTSYFSKLPDPEPGQPIYLTREMMVQLSANIDSGFFYLNNAFELMKQTQLELFHARNTLERIYKSQNGGGGDTDAGPQDEEEMVGCGERKLAASPLVLPNASPVPGCSSKLGDGETFQFQLDPWPLLNCGVGESPVKPAVQVESFVVKEASRRGRGATSGRRGRRGGGVGRGRGRSIEFSSYDSYQANKREPAELIETVWGAVLNSTGELGESQKLVKTLLRKPQLIIPLEDLKKILDSVKELGRLRYSSKEVEEKMARNRGKRKAKVPRKADAQQGLAEKMGKSCDEDVSKANEELISGKPKERDSANNSPGSTAKDPLPQEASGHGREVRGRKPIPSGLPDWKEFRMNPKALEEVWAQVNRNLEEIARKNKEEKEKRAATMTDESGKCDIESVTDTNPTLSPRSDLNEELRQMSEEKPEVDPPSDLKTEVTAGSEYCPPLDESYPYGDMTYSNIAEDAREESVGNEFKVKDMVNKAPEAGDPTHDSAVNEKKSKNDAKRKKLAKFDAISEVSDAGSTASSDDIFVPVKRFRKGGKSLKSSK